jgi:hypothetical protein
MPQPVVPVEADAPVLALVVAPVVTVVVASVVTVVVAPVSVPDVAFVAVVAELSQSSGLVSCAQGLVVATSPVGVVVLPVLPAGGMVSVVSTHGPGWQLVGASAEPQDRSGTSSAPRPATWISTGTLGRGVRRDVTMTDSLSERRDDRQRDVCDRRSIFWTLQRL